MPKTPQHSGFGPLSLSNFDKCRCVFYQVPPLKERGRGHALSFRSSRSKSMHKKTLNKTPNVMPCGAGFGKS